MCFIGCSNPEFRQSVKELKDKAEELKGTKIQRPSTFCGAASSPSVSRRPSIKDLTFDSRVSYRTSNAGTYGE